MVARMIELASTIQSKHLSRVLRFTGVVNLAAPAGRRVKFFVVGLLRPSRRRARWHSRVPPESTKKHRDVSGSLLHDRVEVLLVITSVKLESTT